MGLDKSWCIELFNTLSYKHIIIHLHHPSSSPGHRLGCPLCVHHLPLSISSPLLWKNAPVGFFNLFNFFPTITINDRHPHQHRYFHLDLHHRPPQERGSPLRPSHPPPHQLFLDFRSLILILMTIWILDRPDLIIQRQK